MERDTKVATGSAIATGAAAGIANASYVCLGAVAAAEATGLAGAAATSSALATLCSGAIAAGGRGMSAGVLAVAGNADAGRYVSRDHVQHHSCSRAVASWYFPSGTGGNNIEPQPASMLWTAPPCIRSCTGLSFSAGGARPMPDRL